MLKTLACIIAIVAVHTCSGQGKGVLSYSQAAFDSDTCCWRKLSKEGKHDVAAIALELYLRNSEKVQNKHSLRWHLGQVYAMSGNNRQAVKYLHKTYNVFYKWFGGEDGRTWYYFAKGTTAFVKGNKHGLERMIRKWKKRYKPDGNYKELTTLYNNWGKPYKNAY